MGIKHPLTQYVAAQNVATGIEIAAIFHNSALLCYHIFQTSRKKKKLLKSNQYLTILTILLTILRGITGCTISFGHHPTFISCKLLMKIMTSGYIANKSLLYFVFLERLISVFAESRYKYSSWFVYSCRVALILYGLLLNILTFLFSNAYYIPELDICAGRWPSWLLMLSAAGDLGIVLSISILFTRKLMLITIKHRLNRLNSSLKDTNEKWIMCEIRKDEKMLNLLRRLVFLTVFALISTFFSLICIALFELASMWTSLDWVINAYCIVFMFQIHQKQYKFMCKRVENAVICNGCLKCYSMHICCPITTLKTKTKISSTPSATSRNSPCVDINHMPKAPPTPIQLHSASQSIESPEQTIPSPQLFQNLSAIPDNKTINIESQQTNVKTEINVSGKFVDKMSDKVAVMSTSSAPHISMQNQYNNPYAKATKVMFSIAENEGEHKNVYDKGDSEIDEYAIDATTPLTPCI